MINRFLFTRNADQAPYIPPMPRYTKKGRILSFRPFTIQVIIRSSKNKGAVNHVKSRKVLFCATLAAAAMLLASCSPAGDTSASSDAVDPTRSSTGTPSDIHSANDSSDGLISRIEGGVGDIVSKVESAVDDFVSKAAENGSVSSD